MKKCISAVFAATKGRKTEQGRRPERPSLAYSPALDTAPGLCYTIPERTCSSMDRAFDYGSMRRRG